MCTEQSAVIYKFKQENGRFIPKAERGYLDEVYGRFFLIFSFVRNQIKGGR